MDAGGGIAGDTHNAQGCACGFTGHKVQGHEARHNAENYTEGEAEHGHEYHVQGKAAFQEKEAEEGGHRQQAGNDHRTHAVTAEHAVRQPAGNEIACDAEGLGITNYLRGTGEREIFLLLQEENTPVTHGMLRNIQEGRRNGDDPNARMPENPFLQLLGGLFIHFPHRFSGEFLHGGQALTFGRIGNENQRYHQAHYSGHGRGQEAPLPTGRRHNETCHHHGDRLTQLRGRAENTVAGTALREREPAGKADGAGRRAHALHPAVNAPQYQEAHKNHQGAQPQRSTQQAQEAQDQIHHGRYAYAHRHESADIAIIGNETVGELTYGIYKIKSRTNDTQLPGRKGAAVYERLLHHTQRSPAHIVQGIGHRHAPESAFPQTLVGSVYLAFRNPGGRWFADAEEGV